ncbi:transposase [Escherichia coli]|uniref:IS3 family transposase n=1 Tax=Escherichia coli TaxID=562 RepID=UPI0017A3BFC4|nr:transposase [Escherichia coli]EHD1376105.1 transposase [Escherichia coli]MCX0887130.1 transposase [Escherichia coli]QUR55196.1 transposase [Escherichia coli]HCO0725062.1 transposase [Escherichia coli]
MLNVQEKVSIVNELRQEWPLSRLLIVSGLPRSTFYYHVRRLAAPDRYQSARALVLKIYHQHKGRYGYRRIRLACRNEGVLLNGKTVRKLMKERKRTARAVLTGMCYSAGSAMRHGSSSLTRLTGQSAMTPSTWRR